MPKGYWVTTYRSISDPNKLAAYAQLAPPAVQPFGGRYLARGTAAVQKLSLRSMRPPSVMNNLRHSICC